MMLNDHLVVVDMVDMVDIAQIKECMQGRLLPGGCMRLRENDDSYHTTI